jgi:phosphonopyruvate decarboxylase
MITAESFLTAARERGFSLYSGVPCSVLKPLINGAIDSDVVRYVGAANEGDAVAIAAGAELGGLRGVVMIQNSGLGNAVNPLTSLTHTFRIPVLLIVTLRGDPECPKDEPQHELMGAITTRMLELMQIEWEDFPAEEDRVPGALDRALERMKVNGTPSALVMRKGALTERPLRSRPGPRALGTIAGGPPTGGARYTRDEMIKAIHLAARPSDVLLATTGYAGRTMSALADRANQLAMVGSMGCVSSLGLGLALAQPSRRVIVIDGDGALIMRLSAVTTIGYERPENLIHIVLDNHVHESTGGQATVSASLDLGAMAAACGYPTIARPQTPENLTALLRSSPPGLTFVHVRLKPGAPSEPPRPTVAPPHAAARLREFLRDTP